MAAEENNKVKIRFKFPSGEEFEAEGSPEFIAQQRADFLKLIGKKPVTASFSPSADGALTQGFASRTAGQPDTYSVPHITPAGLAAAEKTAFHPAAQPVRRAQTMPLSARETDDLSLWNAIARTEEGLVLLKRKSRLLAPDTAALLLLGAAKTLLGAREGYGALALAKSLKKSGYGGGRLDRVLAQELRQGSLKAAGTKRGRSYILSDEGFARAYVLAGKIAESL